MGIFVHHQPVNRAVRWKMHVWQAAWDGNNVWDTVGTQAGAIFDFELPDASDLRRLQFQFHYTSSSGAENWEPGDFTRRLFQTSPKEVWTFDFSPRVLYENPNPAGVTFNPGDVLTFHVITQSAFRGGRLYVWNPYDPTGPNTSFGEAARDDATHVSTFKVSLAKWMTAGFHLKLMRPGGNDYGENWEPNASNRVWRPCDGISLWLKSGQCDVRNHPLTITTAPLEVLYSAQLAVPPRILLTDLTENSDFSVTCAGSSPFSGNGLFKVASYNLSIYPGATYALATQNNVENPPIQRLFPADPTVPGAVSRFALGAGAWLASFPSIGRVPLFIQHLPVSSFQKGVSVQASVGNGPAYETVAANQQPDGSWQAILNVGMNIMTSVVLLPVAGSEPRPYDWINTSRYFTPIDATTAFYTTEGVYGVCAGGPTTFADPPNRSALMRAAFGTNAVAANIFAAREMPHGATLVNGQVYFVVHAPHAVRATLVLVDETSHGGPTRATFPMSLTNDTFYWWVSLPSVQTPPGTRYRFLLNDDVEVIDPAARSVYDAGSLRTSFGEDPADPSTSWSVVLDVAMVSAAAHVQPWQTMGWQNLLIYEMHAKRFTNLQPGSLTSFGLLSDELNATSRLGKTGYLRALPVTVFGLMPVNEFNSAASWGYDPSYYFAIDGSYGGAQDLANFVNAAHANGRGVMLDVVYNHSLGSSLMNIAPDVYRNGDYDGDRMNCGHPIVVEFLRQASIYLFRTFNLDGFRFDDTKTIVTQCQGGWEFLGMIRRSLRAAASAEGRAWPYCVAENSATNPWDVSNPSWGVMDGQWDIDEVYRIRDASYDVWHAGWDDSLPLEAEMNKPQYWGRPFHQATRFGESHDMVSAQDPENLRIAARPPFGQGYQLAKALGTLTLLSNGVPMLFMGQEAGETRAFALEDNDHWIDPQQFDLPTVTATDQTRILAWFRQLMGLRNDQSKGLQGDSNYQTVATGNRTVAFSFGFNGRLFAVVTFGTPNQQQNSGWLGLPTGSAYKEIFNSSWPAFAVESEPEMTNGGYDAQIYSGQTLNLPWMGAMILERK